MCYDHRLENHHARWTINRIQLLVLPHNLASKRVAEKCGFKFEGIARGAFFHNGKNNDTEVYSIVARWLVLEEGDAFVARRRGDPKGLGDL